MVNEFNTISFLDSNSYLDNLGTKNDGEGNVHQANIAWRQGVILRSWVKIFDQENSRGALNECLGYILARKIGLPVADYAGILRLDLDDLPDRNMEYGLKKLERHLGYTVAWTTSNIDGVNQRLNLRQPMPKEIYNQKYQELVMRLSKWPLLTDLLAFDCLVMNTDRNLGNLLELPGYGFTLLDHERILGSTNWTLKEIQIPNLSNVNLKSQNFDPIYLDALRNKNATNPLLIEQNCIQDISDSFKKINNLIVANSAEIKYYISHFIADEALTTGIKGMPFITGTDVLFEALLDRSVRPQLCEDRYGSTLRMLQSQYPLL